jgi:hypothetical protein
MRGEGDLYDLVEDNIGEPLPLHVYNVDTNQVREVCVCSMEEPSIGSEGSKQFYSSKDHIFYKVVIIPSEEWGGDGLLGCNVGYG